MTRLFAFTALILFSTVTTCLAKERCGGSDTKFYDDALIFHLSKNGVPYRKTRGGGLCVEDRYSPQFEEAERNVERYFHDLAHRIRDACEERALVEWAQKEGLRFDVRPALDGQYRPAGSMFFLRAFTHEEWLSNKDKLYNLAPRGAACKK